MASRLQSDFVEYAIKLGGTFTAGQAFEWYKENKAGERLPDRSDVYRLIIDPLLYKGEIEKLSRGIYAVSIKPLTVEEDEWDSYLSKKLTSTPHHHFGQYKEQSDDDKEE